MPTLCAFFAAHTARIEHLLSRADDHVCVWVEPVHNVHVGAVMPTHSIGVSTLTRIGTVAVQAYWHPQHGYLYAA